MARDRIVTKVKRPVLTKKEIKESGSSPKEITKIYESQLPDLISNNLRLQKRALEVIEQKIDSASAAQAATIYGILSDKTSAIMGKTAQGGNTINMIFNGSDAVTDPEELMEKVLARARSKEEAIEVKPKSVKIDE